MNKQYCQKIHDLEEEADQVQAELSDSQRQLQELEVKQIQDPGEKQKLQEYRNKVAAAQSKAKVSPENIVSPSGAQDSSSSEPGAGEVFAWESFKDLEHGKGLCGRTHLRT